MTFIPRLPEVKLNPEIVFYFFCHRLQLCVENPEDCSGEIVTPQYQRLQHDALRIERQTIIRLRNEHLINDEALRRIQRDLDLAEARLTGDRSRVLPLRASARNHI